MGFVVAVIAGFHAAGAVTLLTVGAGDQHGTDALVGALGEHPARADDLVIGVSMHSH